MKNLSEYSRENLISELERREKEYVDKDRHRLRDDKGFKSTAKLYNEICGTKTIVANATFEVEVELSDCGKYDPGVSADVTEFSCNKVEKDLVKKLQPKIAELRKKMDALAQKYDVDYFEILEEISE